MSDRRINIYRIEELACDIPKDKVKYLKEFGMSYIYDNIEGDYVYLGYSEESHIEYISESLYVTTDLDDALSEWNELYAYGANVSELGDEYVKVTWYELNEYSVPSEYFTDDIDITKLSPEEVWDISDGDVDLDNVVSSAFDDSLGKDYYFEGE